MSAPQKLTTVHHLAVNVANLEKSVQWYKTSFACEVVHQDRTQAVLQFENIRLALIMPSLEPAHVAYEKADAEKLGELRERADGLKSTFVSDPTGNVVELIKPLS